MNATTSQKDQAIMKALLRYPARAAAVRSVAILLLLCAFLVSAGCTYEEQRRGVIGAAGGAIAGGILGGGRGAAAGAVIGGLVGAATAPAPRYYDYGYYPRRVPPYGYGYYHY